MGTRLGVGPVELHLDPDRLGKLDGFDRPSGQGLRAEAGGTAAAGAGGKGGPVNQPSLALGGLHAGDHRFQDPVLPLLSGHAAHAFTQADAEPGEVGIGIDQLRDRGARVLLDDVGRLGVAEVVVVHVCRRSRRRRRAWRRRTG